MRVEGTIRFPGAVPAPCTAEVFVRVEDVSLADAPAVTVAEQVIHGAAVRGGATLAFAFDEVEIRPRARYTVRVHADCDGDGQVSRGDFVSVQSHPVAAGAGPARLEVPVRRVD